MISFRQHIVTLVAVFLALAVGVVLGGGPLSDVAGTTPSSTASTSGDSADAATEAFNNGFAKAVAPKALAGALTGKTVVTISMPGADDQLPLAVVELVKQASGTVVGQYNAEPKLVQPSEKSLVDSLGSQMDANEQGFEAPAGLTTYPRMGALMARAIASPVDDGQAADAPAEALLASLKAGEMLTEEDVDRRGSLILVLLGDEPQAADGGAELVASLLAGLKTGAKGVVVAGDTASGENGLLSAIRSDKNAQGVSSVDSVQTRAGQIAAVLALAASANGINGAYGASGADGALPVG